MFFRVPHLNKSLVQLGESSSKVIAGPSHRVLIWNIYKGQKKDFLSEIRALSSDKDFLLLQEVVLWPEQEHLHCPSLNRYLWQIGLSFRYLNSGLNTGVAVGSVFPHSEADIFRSQDRELFFLTPKMAVISKFNFIEQGKVQDLMIVNCHALNFTLNKSFFKSFEDLTEKISQHHGPLIVAGDFNTWNRARWVGLLDRFKNIHLEHILPEEDLRLLKLDHVFARGIRVLRARVLMSAKGSDHYPIEFEFSLNQS